MKRLYSILISLGLTTVATITHAQLTSPVLTNGFNDFDNSWGSFIASVTGLYLRPAVTNEDLDYASVGSVATDPDVDNNFNTQMRRLDPDYSWDWGISLGYVFPQTANDITVSYFHFGEKENAFTGIDRDDLLFPINFFEIFPTVGLELNQVTAKVDFEMDELMLTAGQSINLGNRLTFHPFVGGEYNNLQRDLDANFLPFTEEDAQVQRTVTISDDSDFKGIGPAAGFDMSYYLDDNIGIVSHFNSALLIGTIDTKDHFFSLNVDPTAEIPPLFISYDTRSIYRIVPEVGVKLGANYSYLFPNQHTNFSLEAGYQINRYWNAIDRLIIGANFQGQSESTGGAVLGRRSASLSLNGPYVSLILRT